MRRSIRLLGALVSVAWALAPTALPASAAPPPHRFSVVLSPRVGDLALAELSFPRAHGRALNGRSLRIVVPAADGHDYIAVGTPERSHGAGRLALVLVASRATKVMIPASLRLRAAAAAALGPIRIRRIADPLTVPRPGPDWLCALAHDGGAPTVRSLMGHGEPIAGAGPAAALAQAFDIACGLPYSPAFRAALQSGPYGEPCSGAACAPEPIPPPAPGPPRCAPCNPAPGSACPLVASEAVCMAGAEETARSTGSGAH